MADWTYVPMREGWRRTRVPPRTLINRFADGKETRRQTESAFSTRWSERYVFDGTERDAAHDFFELKGTLTQFTKLAYDDHAAPTGEKTVRFDGSWEESRLGVNAYEVVLGFLEVVP